LSKLSVIRNTKADSIATARLSVETSGEGFFEITAEVTRFLKQIGARDGTVLIYLRHTSGSLVIQENADPDVRTDPNGPNGWQRNRVYRSGLVLAAFGMKDMVNLRIVAICSNVAFIANALLLDLPPVLMLHVILLPLNGWRLIGALKQRSAMALGKPSVPLRPVADFIAD
jgi:hypothetical protein